MRSILLVTALLAAAVAHGQYPATCSNYTSPFTAGTPPTPTCDHNAAYRNLILSKNPIAYWPLDDCSPTDTTTFVDMSGHGRNGTASTNAPGTLNRLQPSLLPGGGGSSVEFHAADNDHIIRASDRIIASGWEKNPTCNLGYTVEFWMSVHDFRGYWVSILGDRTQSDWGTTYLHYFNPHGHTLLFGRDHQGAYSAKLPLDQPTHIVSVYDRVARTMTTYYNGTQVVQQTNINDNANSHAADFFIGRDDSPTDGGGHYTLDEIVWYDYPFAAAEVEEHHNTAITPAPPTTEAPPVAPVPTACACANALTADYKNTLAPDAAQLATTSIALNTDSWEVEFDVVNVLSVTNGHVIAAPIEARSSNVTASIEAFVSAPFDAAALWNPPSPCYGTLSGIDTPAAGLGVAVTNVQHNCTRNFHVKYSLIDSGKRTSHCTLSNNAQNEVQVDCELQLNTIRAYDLTEANAYLAKETVFRASITMPRNLPSEVSTLLHASLAKCSVYAAPLYLVDCRIPSLWNFDGVFSVTQSPSWIRGSTCQQTNDTVNDATFIRCELQSISQIYTEASATIAATVLPSGQTMNFNVNYSLPREETATATGSLASFVKSIGTKDGKFFYGNDDLLTLEIEVVDTTRLQITQLELFNSDSPVQTYDLRAHAQFETVETQNATFFVVTFYPARMLSDSNFYLHGPHGVNVSFLFTAARRQEGENGGGVVTYNGIGLKAPKDQPTGSSSSKGAASSGPSTVIVAGVAAGALVVLSAIVVGSVIVVRRSKKQAMAAEAAKETPAVVSKGEDAVAPEVVTKAVDVVELAEV